MTFKSSQSDIEFQDAHDGKEFGYEFTCYDCNLVTRNEVESMFNDGHCRIANVLDAMDHLRTHIEAGDMVEPSLIHRFQSILKRRSFVHQSLCTPNRRMSNKREKAFFEQWLHEQRDDGSTPMCRGLFESWGIQDETPREVAIMASLIQWLGTNVGFCFLESALKRCGYRITKIEEKAK